MAKKTVTAEPIRIEEKRPFYAGYEMTAASEYYIYGRGNAEDYARSIGGIKEELRKSAYEAKRQEPVVEAEEPKVEEKVKKTNGRNVWIALFSLLSLVVFFLRSVIKDAIPLKYGIFTMDGVEFIRLVAEQFKEIGNFEFNADGFLFISLVCVAAIALMDVILFIAGLVRCRSAKTGGFIKTIAIVELLFAIALVVFMTFCTGAYVLTGMVIMAVIAVIVVALAFGGNKDKRGGKKNA